jgi:NitT/TauT family transport system ATP-binding protein
MLALVTSTVFECRALTYSLNVGPGVRNILEDINLTVQNGEFLTVVGGSGTGKTSLLRLLSGLAEPTGGTITYRGKQVSGPPEGVVLVFQDYSRALLQWRSVSGNVALGLEAAHSKQEVGDRVREVLALVGLAEYGTYFPWQLSGGMQQRVQIARALALQPDVLMMDEPFGALDAMTKAGLQDELQKLHARTGRTFVFITHDIEEAVYLGDRVIVLGGTPGRIHSVVPIDLPRPRDQIETRQTPRFLQLRAKIHAAVRQSAGPTTQ